MMYWYALQMTKRQSSGAPHVDGNHAFNDGYTRGKIHYSGVNSTVRKIRRTRRRRGGGEGVGKG